VLHLRVTAPADICSEVLATLEADPAVANVAVMHGAVDKGKGDLILFDVAREAANPIIESLREHGVLERGSLSISETSAILGDDSDRAERAAPGHPSDGVVWEEVEDRAREESRLSWSFLAFLILATLIAGVGRYLDQPILIIGAMVVGPEFAPLSAICVAIVRRRPVLIPRAARTLFGGFAIAITVAGLLWAGAAVLGLIDAETATNGTQTAFIVKPDVWSFIIAVLAGIAGILSITSAKSSALVGVFISITTVPAAATIALTLAVGAWAEAGASAIQLGVNLLGLLIGGIGTLLIQVALTRRRRERGLDTP
jgi:uncharacterized hydrophobic protein (TIGR00271 family)